MKAPPQTRVIVGVSGGVDSAVAAWMLLQQGYQVEALFMKNWEEDDDEDYCAATEDLADAQQVCDTLGIKLHSVNFSAEYWDRVFEYFLQEYRQGRTPNPDILCNKEIKFRAFLDHAKALGADFIATGHYARIAHHAGQAQLLRGLDNNKDQSYFLHALNAQQLASSLFPLGELQKSRVREIAREQGFIVHNKKDSTGICFIGERRFKDFLQRYLPAQPGPIVDLNGNLLGQHSGLMYYTTGQRQGLGIGGQAGASEEPWFVVYKDLPSNRLLVAQGHEHPTLRYQHCELSQLHWINQANDDPPYHLTAKVRYRAADVACTLEPLSDNRHRVSFEQAQWALASGQSLVLYEGHRCLGGGLIEAPNPLENL